MKKTTISIQHLEAVVERFNSVKVMVIGDLMLDRYLWGKVERISPEAPVPVVALENETKRLGGAANVVNNISSLGAIPIPIGVLGRDSAGTDILSLLSDLGFTTDGILVDEIRHSTVKTRIIAHEQHVVRVDRETIEPISSELCSQLLDLIREIIEDVDAILFEDYNKGLLIPPLIHGVVELAHRYNKITTVDPKFDHFFEYSNTTLFKPNRKEAEGALGLALNDDASVRTAGNMLLQRLNSNLVLITMGEKGMYLFDRNQPVSHIETRARRVHDVSGAGDTVISTFTIALAAGATPYEAALLANFAAGVVVGEVGVVPIEKNRLLEALKDVKF